MQNLTIITLNEPNITNFAEARNRELVKAKTEWVLFIDSDEFITPELKQEILDVMKRGEYDAFYIKRVDNFLGRDLRHGEPGNAKFVRLAKKDYGKWVRPVHEIWTSVGARRGSPVKIGTLKNPILHTPHKSISTFLNKINTYSTLDAQYRYDNKQKSSILKIIFYPFAKFIYNYIFLLGFLDGVPGAIMAIMMSFHSYLTWTKLYLLWRKK